MCLLFPQAKVQLKNIFAKRKIVFLIHRDLQHDDFNVSIFEEWFSKLQIKYNFNEVNTDNAIITELNLSRI